MPERHRREQRGGRPVAAIDPGPDAGDAGGEERQRDQVQAEKQRWQVIGRQPCDRCDRFVHECEPCLRVDQRSIARKQGGIQLTHDSRPVERQVGGAVAVTRGVGGGKEDENEK